MSFENKELVILSDTCRVCLNKKDNMKNLLKEHEEVEILLKKLVAISNFEVILNDTLPSYLCSSCEIQLELAYEFRTLCQKSNDLIWKCFYSNAPIELDVPEEDTHIEAVEIQSCTKQYSVKQDVRTTKQKKLKEFPADEVMNSVKIIQESFSKPVNCVLCDFESSNRKSLSFHMTKIHSMEKKNWCIHCNALFDDLNMHLGSTKCTKNLVCTFCNKEFNVTSHLIEHLFYHADTPQNICPICKKSFFTTGKLSNHVKTHLKENNCVCPICSKEFFKRSRLKSHIKNHDLTCPKCMEKLSNVDLLLSHHCEQPVENTLCDDSNELNYEDVSKSVLDYEAVKKKEKQHLCTYCGKSFNFAGHLTIHTRSHTGYCPYKCQTCTKSFTTRSQLINHERVHTGEKPHICNYCGKGFSQTSVLRTHLKLHTGRPEKCMFCTKTFCRPSELKIHLRKHTGERPYSCEVCKQTFISKVNLNDHMVIHSDDRPFKCQHCEKAFKLNSILKSHEQIHLGLKPFKCPHCSYACRQKYSLNQHIHNNHSDTEHKCDTCAKTFTTNKELFTHLSDIHGGGMINLETGI